MSTETKCPFNHAAGGGTTNRDWWPNLLNVGSCISTRPSPIPWARISTTRRVQESRPCGREEGPLGADDRLAALVAGGLRSLRALVHPDGMAQRRHLSHRRRPRRREQGQPAFRPAQQLARQRQPRQGTAAALADQAKVWPEDFLGRPDDPHRQRRSGIDGFQDLRFRGRARGHLGAGRRRQLGFRKDLAGRRYSLRSRRRGRRKGGRRDPGRRPCGRPDPRPQSSEAAGGGADGPDLCQPPRPRRQSRSDRRRFRYPRNLRAHGDERRGNRRADRRRALLRQNPRRRRRESRGGRSRSRRSRGAGPRLEEQLRQRHRPRRDHQRPGSHLDHHADQVEQQLL